MWIGHGEIWKISFLFLAGWLLTSHFALGLEIEESVTRISLWSLGTLQILCSLGAAVKKCPVSHGCSMLMGRTWLQTSASCFFYSFHFRLVSSDLFHRYVCRAGCLPACLSVQRFYWVLQYRPWSLNSLKIREKSWEQAASPQQVQQEDLLTLHFNISCSKSH